MSKKKLAKPAEVEAYEPDYDGWAEPDEYEAFNPFSKPTDPDVKPGSWTPGYHESPRRCCPDPAWPLPAAWWLRRPKAWCLSWPPRLPARGPCRRGVPHTLP